MDITDKIIYEDEDFVIINKDSGMLAIPDRFNKELPNLYDILTEKYGKIFIVHRLDKDTSGLMIFAKNPEAHRDLSMKWEQGEVSKTYYALVTGRFDESEGKVDMPLSPLKKKKGVMVIDKNDGKNALTLYKVLEKYKDFTLLEVMPKTGRTHQIRVHLAGIGHPLAVDPLYNRKEAIGKAIIKNNVPRQVAKKIRKKEIAESKFFVREDVKPPIDRLPLHAGKIKFVHFRTGLPVEFEAPMPKDMKTALDLLSLHSFFLKEKKK
jgi:RluA family pseudouridine synthase